jgi:hypothetical protein
VMTFTPAVSWATTFPSGATQQDYRAVMYSAAQYSAPGFVAGISPSTWDTGVVASSGTSVAPPSSVLANNTTYRAYVQVTESGSENSTWSYATFTLAVDTPATPAVTVTAGTDPVTGAPTVTVVLQGSDNLLSANDGSFETGVGTWTCGSATLASDTTHPEDGTHDLKITATAAASLAPTTGFYAVQPSTQYSAGADFLAGSTGRTVGLSIGWYTSADALISTSVGTATTDSSAGYVRATVTATSPSNAAYAKVVASITSVANTEVHYLEDVCLRPGASATFTTGGAAGSVTDELQYSDDGVTWADVRGGGALTVPASQQISVIDYEMIPGTARQYRAQGSYLVTGNVVVSPWSTPVTATVTTTTWWAVVPGTPTLNTSMDVQTQTTQVLERSASHYGLGDTYPTVLADVVGSIDGTITVQSQSAAAYNALLALVQAQTVIWLTSPVSGGSSVTALYVRLGIPSGSSSGSTAGNTAHASSLEVSPGSTPLRNTTYSYVAMPKP